jgi:hypothetical protein
VSGHEPQVPGTADVVPGIITVRHVLTAGQLEQLRAEWERIPRQPPRLLTPLPRRTRLRLWLARQADHTAIWLLNHDHDIAAGRLWRLTGHW